MRKIICAALILFPSFSWAFFAFEPFIGYNRGQEQASRLQGIGIGAKAGIQLTSFFLLVDFAMHDTQQGSISSMKYTDVGVDFGFDMGTYRLWYGLVSSSKGTYKSGVNDIVISGSGSKIGMGTDISSKVSLNLELRTLDFTESDTAGVSTPIAELATIGFLSISARY